MNKELPKGSKILFADLRTYYLEHEFLSPVHLVSQLLDVKTLNDSQALLARLKELGITHIFYFQNPPLSFQESQLAILYAMIEDLARNGSLKEIYQRGMVHLYQL